jgi:hypothetical protein
MMLFLILQIATGADADFGLARVASPRRSSCGSVGDGDVVVCGARPDRYRLPLPREAPASDTPSEASGMTAITPSCRCGIFAGERRCSKREALAYGYGGGRDPVSVVIGVAKAIADPDR